MSGRGGTSQSLSGLQWLPPQRYAGRSFDGSRSYREFSSDEVGYSVRPLLPIRCLSFHLIIPAPINKRNQHYRTNCVYRSFKERRHSWRLKPNLWSILPCSLFLMQSPPIPITAMGLIMILFQKPTILPTILPKILKDWLDEIHKQ